MVARLVEVASREAKPRARKRRKKGGWFDYGSITNDSGFAQASVLSPSRKASAFHSPWGFRSEAEPGARRPGGSSNPEGRSSRASSSSSLRVEGTGRLRRRPHPCRHRPASSGCPPKETPAEAVPSPRVTLDNVAWGVKGWKNCLLTFYVETPSKGKHGGVRSGGDGLYAQFAYTHSA
jgi:hypothetical protein